MLVLMEFCNKYKEEVFKKIGVKFGFMSVFLCVVVFVMCDIFVVNVLIEGFNGGDIIVYRDYVDISVVVVIEKGFVIFVVCNVEVMDFVGIERFIVELGKKVCLKLLFVKKFCKFQILIWKFF